MTEPSENPIELAKDLIRCPSVTPEDAGALDVLERALSKVASTAGGPPSARTARCRSTISSPASARVPEFLLRRPRGCRAAGRRLTCGFPPFAAKVENGTLYGRGAADMKSAISAFVAAALDFAKRQAPIPVSISLLITGDEEGPSINGTRVPEWMAANGEQPDHCIVGEPTNSTRLGDTIKIGRRGSLTGCLRVKGVQGHVGYPDRAKNPLPGLVASRRALYAAARRRHADFSPRISS